MRKVSPATVMSALALFFSLGGVGIAASRYLITSKRQIAPWVRASLRGQRGPRGLPGPAGTPGTQGPQGAAGPAADGQSPVVLFSQNTKLTTGSPRTTLEVQCPDGEFPVGGGYSANPSVLITTNRADVSEYLGDGTWRPVGWLLQAQLQAGQTDGFVQASVECASRS